MAMTTEMDPALAAALAALWQKHLPLILERMAALDDAVHLAIEARLDGESQAQAMSAAHKLAGVLGSFALAEGTDLAREAEGMLAPDAVISEVESARLAAIAKELRAMIENRK